MNKIYRIRVLIAAVVCGLLLGGVNMKVLAQQNEPMKVLVAKKRTSHKEITIIVGQKVDYRTSALGGSKKKIVGITNTTITFEYRKSGTVTIPFEDLTALRVIKPNKELGTFMIVIGALGGLIGGLIVTVEDLSKTGSKPGASTAVGIAAVGLIVGGVLLVQPDEVELSTLKAVIK